MIHNDEEIDKKYEQKKGERQEKQQQGFRGRRHADIFRVRSIVEMPRLEIFAKFDRYPNKYFPSDHFSLVAEFEYNF